MRDVFNRHCYSLLAVVGKESLAQDFENLIEVTRVVSLRLPSRGGVCESDVDMDPRVRVAILRLEKTASEIEKKEAEKPEVAP